MAKTKFITERPVIIVSVSTNSWTVTRNSLYTKGDYCFTQLQAVKDENGRITHVSKEVHPKPETLAEDGFRCQAFSGYSYQNVDSEGNYLSYLDKPKLMTAKEALKALTKHTEVRLVKVSFSYYNTETGEKTRDKKVAANWFKGRNPLFIERSNSQQIGVWVKPAKDHVEISYYVLEQCVPGKPIIWKKAEDTGYWLYPDGTVSHFWKGRLGANNRKFSEERQKYQSLDVDSILFTPSQWHAADLRQKEIMYKEESSYLLAKETLKILKQCGFPERYWTWSGDTSYKFIRTRDLIFYAKHNQGSAVSKTAVQSGILTEQITLNLEDLSSLVVTGQDGILVKIPGILLTWTANDGSETPYYYTGECVSGKKEYHPSVRRLEIYCEHQLWIKNNGSELIFATANHLGKNWKTTPMSDYNYDLLSGACNNVREDKMTNAESTLYKSLSEKVAKAHKYILKQIVAKVPVLKYYQHLLSEDGEIKGKKVLSLLNLLFKAPKTFEFLVKQGMTSWLTNSNYNYEPKRDSYSLSAFLKVFGLSGRSFKEKKTKSLYQNLTVTKEQFHFLLQEHQKDSRLVEDCMLVLRDHSILLPVKTGIPQYEEEKNARGEYKVGDIVAFKNVCYCLSEPQFEDDTKPHWEKAYYPRVNGKTDISKIPLKYLQETFSFLQADCLKSSAAAKSSLLPSYYSYNYGYTLNRLIQYYNFEDLSTIARRGLLSQTLFDYLDMVDTVKSWSPDFNDEPFVRIPKDVKHLKNLHDEITEIYNMLRAERNYNYYKPTDSKVKEYEKKLKELNKYIMESEDYMILVPQNLIEVAQEGAELSHCAATYIPRIAIGETYFFFLRKKEAPTKPLVTFNIVVNGDQGPDGKKWVIDQIHGKCNRAPTPEEETVVRKWATLHGIAMRGCY